MSKTKVELSEVIDELRSQLLKARLEGAKKRPRFVVDEAEIELQVGITAGGEATGGVSFWVFTVEAGGKLERETTQTIRLKLKPLDPDGGEWETSGSAPRPDQGEAES